METFSRSFSLGSVVIIKVDELKWIKAYLNQSFQRKLVQFKVRWVSFSARFCKVLKSKMVQTLPKTQQTLRLWNSGENSSDSLPMIQISYVGFWTAIDRLACFEDWKQFFSGFGWICEIRTPPSILSWFPPNLVANEVGCKDDSIKKLYVLNQIRSGCRISRNSVFDPGQDCANVQLVDLKPEASKQRLSSRCWLSKSQSCYLDSLKTPGPSCVTQRIFFPEKRSWR